MYIQARYVHKSTVCTCTIFNKIPYSVRMFHFLPSVYSKRKTSPRLPSLFPIPLPCVLSTFFRRTDGQNLTNLSAVNLVEDVPLYLKCTNKQTVPELPDTTVIALLATRFGLKRPPSAQCLQKVTMPLHIAQKSQCYGIALTVISNIYNYYQLLDCSL